MESERCPFGCGAEKLPRNKILLTQENWEEYECGALVIEGKPYGARESACYKGQIANLQAELATAQEDRAKMKVVLELEFSRAKADSKDKYNITQEWSRGEATGLDFALNLLNSPNDLAVKTKTQVVLTECINSLEAVLLRITQQRHFSYDGDNIDTLRCVQQELKSLLSSTPSDDLVVVKRDLWNEALTLVAEHPGQLSPGYWQDRISKFFNETNKAALKGKEEV